MNYRHLFTTKTELLDEMIRVNHAGELGAKFIYLGQLKALHGDIEILEMLEGELKHLEFFENEIAMHGYRPSILNPIWQKCAFLMGFLSAKHSRQMAMLCTQKVEEVIEKHYGKQVDLVEDEKLKQALIQFRKEELEHLHVGERESGGLKKCGAMFTFFTQCGIVLSSKL